MMLIADREIRTKRLSQEVQNSDGVLMLIEALQAVLAADLGMQSYLGTPLTRTDKSNGIWPVQAPDQPTMPYLVLRQLTGNPLQESLQGTGCLTTERWRFMCAGTTWCHKRASCYN